MAQTILIVPAALLVALSGVAAVYVLGMRARNRTVRQLARRFHHAIGNPLQMRRAGTSASHAVVVRHRGRTTGRMYETPVWAAPTEDGFVIALVYGPRTDWLRNVLAHDGAVIVHDGVTSAVDRPEVVPWRSVAAYFPTWIRRLHRLVRVEQCLRVRAADKKASPPAVLANRELEQGGRR